MVAHDNPDNAKNLMITIGVIVLQVIVGLVLGTLLMVICWKIGFTGKPPALAYLIGMALWAMVLFGTNTHKLFFIIIEPNWAAVLRNQRMSDVIPASGSTTDVRSKDPRTTLQDLKSLREIGSGISGKLPWEVPVATIDTRSEVVIGTTDGKPFKCVTSDGAEVDVRWQVILTALRGCLKKLVRKGEVATQAFFKGRCEQIIRNWVAGISESEIRTKDAEFKKYFELAFGGDNTISEEEAENGIFTNSPQILSFDRSAEFQKAKEAAVVAKSVASTIEQLRKELGEGVDDNLLLMTASALAGRTVDGVLLIPGMTGDPKALLAIKALMDELKKEKGKK